MTVYHRSMKTGPCIVWQVYAISLLYSVSDATQCDNSSVTISAVEVASSLAACATFTGTITLASDAPLSVMPLEGIETIVGDLIVANNSYLTAIASSSLQSVTGNTVFANLPLLANITLPMWTTAGTITLNNIPEPEVLKMPATQQQVTNVHVTNTNIEGLFGLSLRNAQMNSLYIVGNRYLQNLEFGVGNITQLAVFEGNGGGPISLPNLTYAYSLQISNASGVDLSSLESVSQNLDLSGNSFSNISAPRLSFVGGDLVVSSNADLDELYFDGLVAVEGSLSIIDNAILLHLGGFPNLNVVGGMLDIVGSFTSAYLPSLKTVRGDVLVESANNTQICQEIPALENQPSHTCNNSSTSPSIHRPTSRHILSQGAVIGIALGAAIPCVLVGVGIGVCIWQCRKGKIQRRNGDSLQRSEDAGTDSFHRRSQKTAVHQELEAEVKELQAEVKELPTKANIHELRGNPSSFLAEAE